MVTGPNSLGGEIQPGTHRQSVGTQWPRDQRLVGKAWAHTCLESRDPLQNVGTRQGHQWTWTYQRHCGNAGARVTVGGPRSCLTSGQSPQGRPTPKLAGYRPKHRWAPTQELDLMSGTPSSYFGKLSVQSRSSCNGSSQCGRSRNAPWVDLLPVGVVRVLSVGFFPTRAPVPYGLSCVAFRVSLTWPLPVLPLDHSCFLAVAFPSADVSRLSGLRPRTEAAEPRERLSVLSLALDVRIAPAVLIHVCVTRGRWTVRTLASRVPLHRDCLLKVLGVGVIGLPCSFELSSSRYPFFVSCSVVSLRAQRWGSRVPRSRVWFPRR